MTDTYIISDPWLLDKVVANGRGFRVEVRPSFTEGDYLGLALRMWGPGHWCIRDGQPSYFTTREDARERGMRWIETGDAP